MKTSELEWSIWLWFHMAVGGSNSRGQFTWLVLRSDDRPDRASHSRLSQLNPPPWAIKAIQLNLALALIQQRQIRVFSRLDRRHTLFMGLKLVP